MTDSKPLNAGHIYSPHFWRGEGNPWKPAPGTCHHSVHDGGRSVTFHQCTRKAVVERDVERHGKPARHAYCKLHDPVAVKAKDDARRAKWQAEWAEKDAARAEAQRKAELSEAAVAALHAIASGHNDPRALAIETLRNGGENI